MPFIRNESRVRQFSLNGKRVNVMRGNYPTKSFKRLLRRTILAGENVILPNYLATRFLVNPRTGYLIQNTIQNRTALGPLLKIDRDIIRFKTHNESFDLNLADVDVFKTLKHIVKRLTGKKIIVKAGAEYFTLSHKQLKTLRKRIKQTMMKLQKQWEATRRL